MTHTDQRCQSSHHEDSPPGPLPWQWRRRHHASASSRDAHVCLLGFFKKSFREKSPAPLRNSLQPPAPLCNDSLGDMGRERRGGGGAGGVLLSCSLAVLFVRPFPRPAGAAERMQIPPQMRTYRRRSRHPLTARRRERIGEEGGNVGRAGNARKRR